MDLCGITRRRVPCRSPGPARPQPDRAPRRPDATRRRRAEAAARSASGAAPSRSRARPSSGVRGGVPCAGRRAAAGRPAAGAAPPAGSRAARPRGPRGAYDRLDLGPGDGLELRPDGRQDLAEDARVLVDGLVRPRPEAEPRRDPGDRPVGAVGRGPAARPALPGQERHDADDQQQERQHGNERAERSGRRRPCRRTPLGARRRRAPWGAASSDPVLGDRPRRATRGRVAGRQRRELRRRRRRSGRT